MNHRLLHLSLAALFAALPAFAQAPTQEAPRSDALAMGKMWTFENPPLAYLEQEYGFKPDQKWLDSLRLGALRFGERENPWCSASFVSPKGLIMTNHHCVRDQVAQVQGDHDWITDGFAAKAQADEVKLPGITVHQLVAQEDITAKVNAGVQPGDEPATVAKKREENQKKLKEEADAAHPGFQHQIVALYQGAVVQLYRYKIYDDIRLVMAVNLQAAHFGGDPDNFTFPRWSIDFAFARAYENDAPADTSANYFRWRQEGAKEGELVFVPGNPGSTNRLFTIAQLECQRDVEYPLMLQQWESEMAIVRPYAQRIPQLMTTLLGIENSYKAITGTLQGLRDARLMAQKTALEQRFRAAVDGKPEWKEKYGGLWARTEELVKVRRTAHVRAAFYTGGYSPHLTIALAVVKAADDSLPEAERTAARETALGESTDVNPLVAALIPSQFERMQKWLPADDPFVKALLGEQDAKGAARKLGRSLVGRKAKLTELLDGGAAAVAASEDFAIVVARALYPLQKENDKAVEAMTAGLAQQGELIGRALFAVQGTKVSPDATMTLRFSDGLVKGYEYNGTVAPWATSFYGLYGRHSEFAGEGPFRLAAGYADARPRIDLDRKVCFVSTNDIVGGNSGSCVVDKDLQVVGLIFDGNIESLPNEFHYTQDKARAVSVHTDAIVESLRKVYDLGRVADELAGKTAAAGERK